MGRHDSQIRLILAKRENRNLVPAYSYKVKVTPDSDRMDFSYVGEDAVPWIVDFNERQVRCNREVFHELVAMCSTGITEGTLTLTALDFAKAKYNVIDS